jgi:hypothetical protein
MNTHLIAPSELIPLITARLTLQAPHLSYTIHTSNTEPVTTTSDDCVIAVQAQAEQTVLNLGKQHNQLIDILINPSPLAPLHGFIVLASGATPSLQIGSPILNALSPMDNGWLHIGQLGACGFVHELWSSLINPHSSHSALDWLKLTTEPTRHTTYPPHPASIDLIAHLTTLMAQQQLQAQTLASLARRYLSDHSRDNAFDAHHAQSQLFSGLVTRELHAAAPVTQLAHLLANHLQYT